MRRIESPILAPPGPSEGADDLSLSSSDSSFVALNSSVSVDLDLILSLRADVRRSVDEEIARVDRIRSELRREAKVGRSSSLLVIQKGFSFHSFPKI